MAEQINADRINYVNIGLMLVSLVAAFILPFEVFLFSYAVLGPLHYLTEISWLHDRKYFAESKFDYLWLVVLGLMVWLGSEYIIGKYHLPQLASMGTQITIAAFGLALIFIVSKGVWSRVFGAIFLLALIAAFGKSPIAKSVFGIYVPTLIHVYLFTGAFILFGALKRNSKSGYISVGVFVMCAVLCLTFDPKIGNYIVGDFVKENYVAFAVINYKVAGHLDMFQAEAGLPETFALFPFSNYDQIFSERASIMVGRFVGFAYTYHYLNWFSKTSIIQWHKIPKARFAAVIVLWVVSVGLYAFDYVNGFKWLFLLSFLHVFLEFPLNHRSFIGIGQEIGKRFGSKKAGA